MKWYFNIEEKAMKWEGDYAEYRRRLSREKIRNKLRALWWRFMPGKTIELPWPAANGALTNDPNHHYRPWLEKNVGCQTWDWDWNVSIANNKVIIKFRIGKTSQMMQALLQWS